MAAQLPPPLPPTGAAAATHARRGGSDVSGGGAVAQRRKAAAGGAEVPVGAMSASLLRRGLELLEAPGEAAEGLGPGAARRGLYAMHMVSGSASLPAAGRREALPGVRRDRDGAGAVSAARRKKRERDPRRNKATIKGRVVKSAIGESWPFFRAREVALLLSVAFSPSPHAVSCSHPPGRMCPSFVILLDSLLVSLA